MRLGTLLLTAVLVAPAAAAQERAGAAAPAFTAAAGFDGYYTAGRWVPVRIDAENRGPDFAGEVRAAWGATVYRQAISLPSPSRKRVEFYVRAADLRDSIEIVLHDTRGRAIAMRTVTVRGLLPAEQFHVVAGNPAGSAAGVRAAFAAAADLPLSWRGYDGVDEVHLDGTLALLPAQARALERWRAVHAIDDVPALRREISRAAPAGTADRDRWRFAATYAGALLVLFGLLPRLARRPAAAHAALVAIALLFTAIPATPRLGESGRPDPFIVRPRTTSAGTFVSALAFAQPAGRATAIVQVPGTEALVEAAADAPPHEIRYAEDGDAAFAIAGSAGEAFSVISRSFESPSHD